MKILISHTTGNENTRNVVYALMKSQFLHTFIVSIAVYKESLFRYGIFRQFLKRKLPIQLRPFVVSFPFKELGRQICNKLNVKLLTKSESSFFSSYSESLYIDKKASLFLKKHAKEIDTVYCFEDIALQTFTIAREEKKYRIYDLPIGYWRAFRKMLADEKEKNPDWYVTLGGFNDSNEKVANKDKEIELANVIFVASTFTKKSLSFFPGQLPPIYVVPYGFPPINSERTYSLQEDRKIRLLYVGGLSQRKGISYMFKALEGLENFYELTVVGGGDTDIPVLKTALSKHQYLPPMPHDKILELMSKSDILIFPSLFEGFGLVITEAMSQGTPVITTDRTCGPDIITNNEDGWIVKAADSTSIQNLLIKLKDDKEEIIRVGKNARETASKRPWEVYQQEMVNLIQNECGGKS